MKPLVDWNLESLWRLKKEMLKRSLTNSFPKPKKDSKISYQTVISGRIMTISQVSSETKPRVTFTLAVSIILLQSLNNRSNIYWQLKSWTGSSIKTFFVNTTRVDGLRDLPLITKVISSDITMLSLRSWEDWKIPMSTSHLGTLCTSGGKS